MMDDPEPQKPPSLKRRLNERPDEDRRSRPPNDDLWIDSPETEALAAYVEGDPTASEKWYAAHSPEAQHRARFINRTNRELDSLSTIPDKLRHINGLAPDIYDELWAHLTIKALREMRETSERAARHIIIEMINKDIITPHAAAKSSGYSRTSVYNWLKEAANNESKPPRQ
jgi:hypothetical protein